MRALIPSHYLAFLMVPLVGVSACGNEIGTTDVNGNPLAKITWPSAAHGDNGEIILEGLVDHTVRSPSELTVRWYIDGDVVCDAESEAAPTATGQTICPAFIEPLTDAIIELEAEYNGVVARDVVQLIDRYSPLKEVNTETFVPTESDDTPNQPPTCEIISPLSGQSVESGALVNLVAVSFDPDQDPVTLETTWTSSIDGVLGNALTADAIPTVGDHTIQLVVTDTSGESCVAESQISVVAPKTHPQLHIA